MELFALFLVAYLVASPDRFSLALSRGISGGVRGAVTGKTPKTRARSPRRRAFVDGWRQGVTTARERREAGRDLWSRGARGAGRLYGASSSLASGVRGAVAARRGRNGDGEIELTSTSPDAVPARRGWGVAQLVKRPKSNPTSEGTAERTDAVDEHQDVTEPTTAKPATEPTTDATTPEKEPNLTTPETTPDAAPTSAPATTTNTPESGAITMPNAVELTNIDELDKFLKGLENVFVDLADACARVKKSGKHLESQWEGSDWGTRGLDRAIADICEEIAGFKVPSADSFAAGRREIAKARSVGETVETAKARGKTEAFTGN